MEEKELMIAVLRILLQRGSINEDVFNSSVKRVNEKPTVVKVP